MRTTSRAGQRGFTLGETLTALAVVGIGLSMATPGLQTLTRNNRQAVSVNQLVSTMHLARSEAAMRNARVTVCASSDGARCDGQPWEQGWITFLDTDGDGNRDAVRSIARSRAGIAGHAGALRGIRERFHLSTRWPHCRRGSRYLCRRILFLRNRAPRPRRASSSYAPMACPPSLTSSATVPLPAA